MGAVEEARALLADETNLNARLLLERLFLQLAASETAPAGALTGAGSGVQDPRSGPIQ